jgi:hypothetical protein
MHGPWRTPILACVIGSVGLGVVGGLDDWSAPAIYGGFYLLCFVVAGLFVRALLRVDAHDRRP